MLANKACETPPDTEMAQNVCVCSCAGVGGSSSLWSGHRLHHSSSECSSAAAGFAVILLTPLGAIFCVRDRSMCWPSYLGDHSSCKCPNKSPNCFSHGILFLNLTSVRSSSRRTNIGDGSLILDGIIGAVPTVLVLLAHEAGHRYIANEVGAKLAVPYFIPSWQVGPHCHFLSFFLSLFLHIVSFSIPHAKVS